MHPTHTHKTKHNLSFHSIIQFLTWFNVLEKSLVNDFRQAGTQHRTLCFLLSVSVDAQEILVATSH